MLTRSSALQQLESTTKELAACHRELAQVLMAEKEGRVRTYLESNETSVSGRDRQADYNVLSLSTDSLKLKGEIAALEAEVRYLIIVVEHGE